MDFERLWQLYANYCEQINQKPKLDSFSIWFEEKYGEVFDYDEISTTV